MKHIVFFLSFILFIGMLTVQPQPVQAGPASVANSNENNEGSERIEIDAEQLDNLIETLESEDQRKTFIGNLKALKDVTGERLKEAGDRTKSLADVLGLAVPAQKINKSYHAFLERYDLDDSSFANWVMTGVIAFIALALMLVNKKLCTKAMYKLNALKDRFGLAHERTRLYAKLLRYVGYLVILVTGAWFLTIAWEVDTEDSVILNMISFSRIFSIAVLILAAIIVWELIDGFMEYSLQSANRMAKARLKTLLPIARNVLLIIFLTLFTMMFLSELGVDVMPLLAGAGVLGIAIGFGAQTMVKDFITGFIIILEDLVQVGDVVKVSGVAGLVERITIRKIELRGLDGTVYTVPFGEITTIENMTKEFSYYLMEVGVAYRENTDEVIKYMREVDEELRSAEEYKDLILAPLEVLGVDKFADSAVIIKARIKTLPVKQWFVGREYNRRMKYKFDEMGVEIPFPHQTIYFGVDKDGTAPAARVAMEAQEASKKSIANADKSKSKAKSKPKAKSSNTAKAKKTTSKKS
jgi:small conductance mechanosensitive channel